MLGRQKMMYNEKKYMKKSFFSVILIVSLILIGAGCQKNPDNGDTSILGEKKYNFEARIARSETLIKKVEAETEKESLNLRELLNLSGINFQSTIFEENEKINALDGVLTTAGKEWNTYVNQEKQNLHLEQIIIKPSDGVEWRYEEVKE